VESLFFDKLFVIMLLSFMFLIEWTFCFCLIIGVTTMARRKAARNNAGHKGKAVRKRHHVCVSLICNSTTVVVACE
jgi:hypothetical protein